MKTAFTAAESRSQRKPASSTALEQFYDVASGILPFSRYQRQIPGTGVNITELTLAGQA